MKKALVSLLISLIAAIMFSGVIISGITAVDIYNALRDIKLESEWVSVAANSDTFIMSNIICILCAINFVLFVMIFKKVNSK